MPTHVAQPPDFAHRVQERPSHRADALRFAVPLGRLLFVLIFLLATPMHFTAQAIDHAAQNGVPLAQIAVPLAGIVALVGALSVLFGYKARFGALLLIIFLVPVTLSMHRFWAETDVQAAMMQRVMFLKNLAILGGAILLSYFGPGPISVDTRHTSEP